MTIISMLSALSALTGILAAWYGMRQYGLKYFIVIILIPAVLLAAMIILLTGCTAKTVYSQIPCVKPTVPAELDYPVKHLKIGDDPATVMKAYVATVGVQQDYIHKQLLPRMQP